MITNRQSGTNVHEVAEGIYRINTPVVICVRSLIAYRRDASPNTDSQRRCCEASESFLRDRCPRHGCYDSLSSDPNPNRYAGRIIFDAAASRRHD